MIYLDYAATTPIAEEALEVYVQAARTFSGNPASLHDIGSNASRLLEKSREELAALLDVVPESIYFTSGGSESNTLALKALLDGSSKQGNHLITSAVEHSSVYNFFRKREEEGFEVSYLPFQEDEEKWLAHLEAALKDTTILASFQHGNSETGTLLPLERAGKLLHERGILFHSDCVQTFGKVPVDFQAARIDSASVSSHKLYGPKGVGAVYLHPETAWAPPFPDISHEKGLRPGTVNVPGIASFATAAERAYGQMERETERLTAHRNFLVDRLSSLPFPIHIEGTGKKQLPHILSFRIEGVEGQYLLLECNRHGVAVSTGTACQVGRQEPSRTMVSLGRTPEQARQLVRLSFGYSTTRAELETVAGIIHAILNKYFS